MQIYVRPFAKSIGLQHFVLTQIASGETVVPLVCAGGAGQCNISLGVDCICPNLAEISFLVPGVNCADIHDGTDCLITPSCTNPQFSSSQCEEGCVVKVTCADNCNGIIFSASCPGFEDCSTDIAAATGC